MEGERGEEKEGNKRRKGRAGKGKEGTKMANSRKYKSWLFDLRRYCVTLSVQKRITSQKSYVHYLYFFYVSPRSNEGVRAFT